MKQLTISKISNPDLRPGSAAMPKARCLHLCMLRQNLVMAYNCDFVSTLRFCTEAAVASQDAVLPFVHSSFCQLHFVY